DIQQAAPFRLVLGRCAWEMGRTEEALAAYEQARAELEPSGPSRDLALAYVRLASLSTNDLDPVSAVRLSRRAIEIAESVGSEDARVQGLNYLACGLMGSGKVEEGLATFDQGFQEAMRLGLYSIALIVLNNVTAGRCEYFLG